MYNMQSMIGMGAPGMVSPGGYGGMGGGMPGAGKGMPMGTSASPFGGGYGASTGTGMIPGGGYGASFGPFGGGYGASFGPFGGGYGQPGGGYGASTGTGMIPGGGYGNSGGPAGLAASGGMSMSNPAAYRNGPQWTQQELSNAKPMGMGVQMPTGNGPRDQMPTMGPVGSIGGWMPPRFR